MNQRERLEQIRKKHEEEQRKRKYFLRRVALGVAAGIVVIVMILLIWAVVSAISNRIEKKRQMQEEIAAALVTPTPAATIDPNVISDAFYNNCAFLGNSFVEDLSLFNLVKNADYFGKTGFTVSDALTKPAQGGTVPAVEEFRGGKQYDRIFMMFGENELGWLEQDNFTDQYEELIEEIRGYQPQSKIYIMAITPINEYKSEEDPELVNMERIQMYNELIKGVATRENAIYADIYKAVIDEKIGELPENAASDGVHFGKDYYEKCLLYIQNNYE